MFSKCLIEKINKKCSKDLNSNVDVEEFFNYIMSDSQKIFNDKLIKKSIINFDERFKRILIKILNVISYKSNLNISFDLEFFDRESVLEDLQKLLNHFNNLDLHGEFENCFNAMGIYGYFSECKDLDYLNRNLLSNKNKSISEVINDSFEMMFLVNSLDDVDLDCELVNNGYRAKILTFTKDSFHYPIKVHFWEVSDFEFNYWATKNTNLMSSGFHMDRLRVMFNSHLIDTEANLQEVISGLNMARNV